jgi:hypothetical protein
MVLSTGLKHHPESLCCSKCDLHDSLNTGQFHCKFDGACPRPCPRISLLLVRLQLSLVAHYRVPPGIRLSTQHNMLIILIFNLPRTNTNPPHTGKISVFRNLLCRGVGLQCSPVDKRQPNVFWSSLKFCVLCIGVSPWRAVSKYNSLYIMSI